MKSVIAKCCVIVLVTWITPIAASAEFKWSNAITNRNGLPDGLVHKTFRSPSMRVDVGYCVYLPPDYDESDKRYSVVYILHGGAHGGDERRLTRIARSVEHFAMKKRPPVPGTMIYVFVNGGAVSFYNYPSKNSMGEDVFVRELIPHIDRTYRTIANRSGRGIEGYSGGGRGAARIAFEYPELFGSVIAASGGFHREKTISRDGAFDDLTDFLPGHNAYDRARHFAANRQFALPLLIAIGTKDDNYENNLEYMTFLDGLNVPYEKLVVENAGHGDRWLYPRVGRELLLFHRRNLAEPQ